MGLMLSVYHRLWTFGDGMTIEYQQEAAEASWQAILRFLAPRD